MIKKLIVNVTSIGVKEGLYININTISKMYNISTHTVRYYEKIGLIKPNYSNNGYRNYSYQHILQMNVIRDLRSFDVSLTTIKDYLDNKTVDKTRKMLSFEKKQIKDSIGLLKKKEKFLKERITLIDHTKSIQTQQVTACFQERRNILLSESEVGTQKLFYSELINLYTSYKNFLFSSNQHMYGSLIQTKSSHNLEPISRKVFYCIDDYKKFDEDIDVIQSGRFLTIYYSGGEAYRREAMKILKEHIDQHNIQTVGPLYEFNLIDFQDTSLEKEHISKIQVRELFEKNI